MAAALFALIMSGLPILPEGFGLSEGVVVRRAATHSRRSGIKQRGMKITSIDHVQLAMPHGEENVARTFYAGVLELPEVPKPPELAKRGGAWFESSTVKVHLGVEPDFRPAKKAHPAFIIDGVDELAARCEQQGYEIVTDDDLPGYKRVYVYDPFGNRLEFMEPLA